MRCLFGCLGITLPRAVLLGVAIFTDYLANAYDTLLYPVLGFFFMPLTTLAYAFAMNEQGAVEGLYLAIVIVAALFDLGLIGGGARSSRRRKDDDD